MFVTEFPVFKDQLPHLTSERPQYSRLRTRKRFHIVQRTDRLSPWSRRDSGVNICSLLGMDSAFASVLKVSPRRGEFGPVG